MKRNIFCALFILFAQTVQAGPKEHYEELLTKLLGHPVTLTSKNWSEAPKEKSEMAISLAADVANEINYCIRRKPSSKDFVSKNLNTITVVYSESGSKTPELKWDGTDLQVITDPMKIDRRWSGSLQTQLKKLIP